MPAGIACPSGGERPFDRAGAKSRDVNSGAPLLVGIAAGKAADLRTDVETIEHSPAEGQARRIARPDARDRSGGGPHRERIRLVPEFDRAASTFAAAPNHRCLSAPPEEAEFARQLGEIGLNVAIVAWRRPRVEELAHELEAKNRVQLKSLQPICRNRIFYRSSLRRVRAVEIGLLVNNAGFGLA